ncbi:MAG: zinc-binding alcohol dehydrogenase family protein [Verrucomicrobiota bacterium]
MQAWLLDAFNGLDSLRLAEVPDPVPAAGEVILEMHYAALNPADRYLAEKQYPAKPALPHILGRDGIGTVIEVGPGVTGTTVGDRRILLRGDVGVERAGTFARRVAVPMQSLVETPADWSEQEAAGATLVYLTAWQALTQWGPLPPSAVVLVTGASGGVGVATVQLASALGCKVIALSRSEDKSKRLLQLGASVCFNPETPQWRQAVKQAIAPHRVDLAVDNIGGKLLPQVIETLGDMGKVSCVGRLAGPVPQFNTASLFFRRLRLGGVAVGTNTPAESRAAWSEVVALLAKNNARPQVDSIFPFDQLPKAFERLANGPMGKVLVRVS